MVRYVSPEYNESTDILLPKKITKTIGFQQERVEKYVLFYKLLRGVKMFETLENS